MRIWSDLKVRGKLLVLIPSVALVLTVSLVWVSASSLKTLGVGILKTNASYLATLAAETIKAAVQYNVEDDIDRVIGGLVGDGADVSVAAVILQDPKELYSIKKASTSPELAGLDLGSPVKELSSSPPQLERPTILRGGSSLMAAARIDLTANDVINKGYVLVGMNERKLDSELLKTTTIMAVIGLAILTLGIVLTFFMATGLTKPLESAAATAVELAKGDLTSSFDPRALLPKDEIGGQRTQEPVEVEGSSRRSSEATRTDES